jgi:N-acetylneuraminate synthase
LEILSRILDEKSAPFVVAELSGNHGGGLDKALNLVSAAKDAGADAIKLQTYRPDTITVRGTDDRFKLKTGLWKGKLLYELYEEAMTPWEWHPIIAKEARTQGMICFSSPFDESAVDFLEESMQPALYKVASFEMNHVPLLERIGKTGKPVLASVGVSESQEIINALKVLRGAGCPEVILLHCVSEYPAKTSDFSLGRMPLLESDYGVKFGLSDHSLGHLVAVAATALGARVIEKHCAWIAMNLRLMVHFPCFLRNLQNWLVLFGLPMRQCLVHNALRNLPNLNVPSSFQVLFSKAIG